MSGQGDRFGRVGFWAVVAALFVAAPLVMKTAGVKAWWLLGLGAVVAAVAMVFAGPAQERLKGLVTRRDEQARALAAGSITTGGRPVRVRDVTDPIRLGVHPAPLLRRYGGAGALAAAERVPVYVTRDIDEELRAAIAGSGFVLLVGDSTAGKSRAAFEAIAAQLPDHVLIAPADRKALAAALKEATTHRRCVLWLDDLERYLGAEGLTRTAIAGLLTGTNHHRVIVATLRAVEEARYADTDASEDAGARRLQQDVRQVIDQAHRIHVGLSFTSGERARAGDLAADDPRIGEALTHADVYGIPEYLACGPQFLAEWENGRARGAHPRGAALVAAAVDCRRVGYTAPLPRELLEEIHLNYLVDKGGGLRAEPVDKAWGWATRVRENGNALLQETEAGTVEVFDYLTDITQRNTQPGNHVPDQIITAVLTHAGPADAGNIAHTAFTQGRYQLTEQALREAITAKTRELGPGHSDTLTTRSNLATVLSNLGRLEEAEAEDRAVLEARVQVLGAEHPDTLTNHDILASVLRRMGRLQEAEAEHRTVLEARVRVLGAEHPDTLTSHNNLATVLTDLARLQEAEAEHRTVLEARVRVLEAEHPSTLTSRANLASVLWRMGRLQEAEAEDRAVLEARVRVLGANHPSTLDSRSNLATVLSDLGRLQEAETEHRTVLKARVRVLGAEHPSTLISRSNLATVLSNLGRSQEAEAEIRAVIEASVRLLGAEHPSTLISRSNLAIVLSDLGRLQEAEAEHRAVLEARVRVLGANHPSTLDSRNYLAAVRSRLRQQEYG